MHYNVKPRKICSTPGCGRPYQAKGFCDLCYMKTPARRAYLRRRNRTEHRRQYMRTYMREYMTTYNLLPHEEEPCQP